MDIKGVDLEKVNFASLRVIARRLGIKSPTVKRKGELIKDIKNVLSGSEEELKDKTRKGRPCLRSLELPEITDIAPVNLSRETIKYYTEKINKLFDEYVEKMKTVNNRFLKALQRLSKE